MTAEIIDEFPNEIEEIEFERIPMSDGVHLSCRYWRPKDAVDNPVPAILEYIPYCTRDGTAARDEAMHPYMAGHGYASIRVDMRGSGESEGVMLDEYLKIEQDDALEAIAWIAEQPWCDGNVGMFGKSWGGFNGLQVAARRPPALRCIITVFSCDDRYTGDLHYLGGCMSTQNSEWAFVMFPSQARPPDPALVGDSWREMWKERLDALEPWAIEWFKHQRRDDYWKHGSVCEDYSEIDIPVYAIGGWADLYSNVVPSLLEGLDSPCKGLNGPWGHQYMHQVVPGPGMGFMDESLRWWDHWLKGVDNGIMDEPAYRVWVQDSVPPKALQTERPGYWATEPSWPSPNVEEQVLYLNDGTLDDSAADEAEVTVCSPQNTGFCTPSFGNMGAGDPEEPADQRWDDATSACFDGEVLKKTLTIHGAPVVSLDVSADQENAFVWARLNEVRADGSVLQISYGVLNLTHRNGHESPEPLIPGERYNVRVKMNEIGHTFDKGSRIRVAVSNAFWPVLFPSPRKATVSIFTGASSLALPIREPRESDKDAKPFPPARQSRVHPSTMLVEPEPGFARLETDRATGVQTYRYFMDTGTKRFDNNGWTISDVQDYTYQIHPDDPGSVDIELKAWQSFGREGQLDARLYATHRITCDETHFHIEAKLDVKIGDEQVYSRTWKESIERDLL